MIILKQLGMYSIIIFRKDFINAAEKDYFVKIIFFHVMASSYKTHATLSVWYNT